MALTLQDLQNPSIPYSKGIYDQAYFDQLLKEWEQKNAQRPMVDELNQLGLEQARQAATESKAGVPYRTASWNEALKDLLAQSKVRELSRAEQEQAIKDTGGVSKAFFDSATSINPKTWMDTAEADVNQAYGKARATAAQEASGMGLNPASKNFQNRMRDLDFLESSSAAGARTRAGRAADDATFSRLGQAMNVRAGIVNPVSAATPPNAATINTNVGSSGSSAGGAGFSQPTPAQPAPAKDATFGDYVKQVGGNVVGDVASAAGQGLGTWLTSGLFGNTTTGQKSWFA